MIGRRQKIKLGVFLVASTVLFVGTLVVFASLWLWRDKDVYTVRSDRSVSGLTAGAAVELLGVRVGTVAGLRLTDDPELPVEIVLRVDPSTRIRADARAFLRLKGITGLKYIDIERGSPDAPWLEPGRAIELGETGLDRIEANAVEITTRTASLLEKSELLVDNLIEVSGPENRERIEVVLTETAELARSLGRASDRFSAAGGNVNRLLRDTRESVQASLAEFDRAAAQVRSLVASANEVVGEGVVLLRDVRRLVVQNKTDLRRSLRDLKVAMRAVRDLASSMQDDPSRLLMTKPPRERKLP